MQAAMEIVPAIHVACKCYQAGLGGFQELVLAEGCPKDIDRWLEVILHYLRRNLSQC